MEKIRMQKYTMGDLCYCYRYGNPYNTEAVVETSSIMTMDYMPYFHVVENNALLQLQYELSDNDMILGLGETIGGINKRGYQFSSFCTDDPEHTEDKQSLYGAHPFFIVYGNDHPPFGVFIDFPGVINFDCGFMNRSQLFIEIMGNNCDIYIIEGTSFAHIAHRFRVLIGSSYIPAKWAFGYQQSRWSYRTCAEVDAVINRMRENDIPCDTVYLDIDYMHEYRNFTINTEAFPHFKNWVHEKKEQGIRLIPIIDAGVSVHNDYFLYNEGIENGYFCTKEDNSLFTGAVWPGLCCFADFMRSDVRQWWGRQYKILTDMGIEGFWNDMNEPAIFYTDEQLQKAMEIISAQKGKNLAVYDFFPLRDILHNLQNNEQDFKSFYHYDDAGIRHNHYNVHNLYGYNMTRAASEGLDAIFSQKRSLIFSRASYIGMHRYGGIWMGDNKSWWSHILLNLHMVIQVNLCGFLYSGADTGGFSTDCSAQLCIRWTQMSLFFPLFRNHNAADRSQEPYAFDEQTMHYMRCAIQFRYALLPYIYSEYMHAVHNNTPYVKALCHDFSDAYSMQVEDQALIGTSIMIAPMYRSNAYGRSVYVPEPMLLWRMRSYDVLEVQHFLAGHHYIDVALDEIPVFIRENHMIVLGSSMNYVHEYELTRMRVIAYVTSEAQYSFYDDDGITRNPTDNTTVHITINVENETVTVACEIESLCTSLCELQCVIYTDTDCFYKTIMLTADT